MERKVRNSSLFSTFMSSFAFQAGYNYDRFQNLGLVAVMLSALKDIYPDPDDLREWAVRRVRDDHLHPARPQIEPYQDLAPPHEDPPS